MHVTRVDQDLSFLTPGGGKIRDLGNEVATVATGQFSSLTFQ